MNIVSIKSKKQSAGLGPEPNAARRRKFAIGDKVKVIGMRPVNYPPGMKDELGTEKLFKSMIGRIYTVRGFDEYRYVELHPNLRNWVWIEPEFLTLRASKKKKRD
jgi:hypothetical protein